MNIIRKLFGNQKEQKGCCNIEIVEVKKRPGAK
jgi:hypothetical protein